MPGDTSDIDSPAAHEPSLRRAAYLTAGVGIAHAVLFFLSVWLLLTTASGSDLTSDVYRRRLTLAGLYLMPFAGIAFIWFIVALRMWISGHVRREDVLLSNVQLVSGILYIALFFAAGAAAATAAASVEFADTRIDSLSTDHFPQYASTLLMVFAVRMAAMFVFTTTNIARSAGVVPRWFGIVGIAVGIFLLLSVSFSRALIVVFPVWVLMLCVLLIVRARQIPAGAVLPSPGSRIDTASLGRDGGGT